MHMPCISSYQTVTLLALSLVAVTQKWWAATFRLLQAQLRCTQMHRCLFRRQCSFRVYERLVSLAPRHGQGQRGSVPWPGGRTSRKLALARLTLPSPSPARAGGGAAVHPAQNGQTRLARSMSVAGSMGIWKLTHSQPMTCQGGGRHGLVWHAPGKALARRAGECVGK